MAKENYIVSARKFRPKHFKDVFGQEHITHTLRNAISANRIAQSYLFCGPRGVGKTTCARIFARAINCTNPNADNDPCDQCESCKQFNANNSVNIFELDAASNNSVDNIRQLNEQVRVRPLSGKYKIYIIDEVHMLSQGAFNAFLKTLEEPPEYAFFILATTEKQKILATILSRCQIFDFKRISNEDMVKQMKQICEKEQYQYDLEALNIIADKSDGCMRDALSLMDSLAGLSQYNLSYENIAKQFNILDEDFFKNFFDAILKQDIYEAIRCIRRQYSNGHEIEFIIESLCIFLRNMMIVKTPRGVETFQNEKQKKLLLRLSVNMSMEFVVNAVNILTDMYFELKMATDKMLLVESRFPKLILLNQTIQFVTHEESNPPIKKKIDGKTINPVTPKITDSKEQNTHQPTTPKAKEEKEQAGEYENTAPPLPEKTSEQEQTSPKKQNGFSLSSLKNVQSFTQSYQKEATPELKAVDLEPSNLEATIKQVSEKLLSKKRDQINEFIHLSKKEIMDSKTLKLLVNSNYEKDYLEQNKEEYLSLFKQFLQQPTFNIVLNINPESIKDNQNSNAQVKSDEDILNDMQNKYPFVEQLVSGLGFELVK